MRRIHSAVKDLRQDFHQPVLLEHSTFELHIQHACQMLEIFMSDPWFTSLWTLQEAFLPGDAVFLSGEVMRANGVEGRDPQSEKFVLGDLIMLYMR